MHRHLCPEAEIVILSRKRIDNDGPESACQSANFQMTQWLNGLARFQPRELHKHLLRGSQLDRSTLRQEFEQLHQAWLWSGLARFGPTTPTRWPTRVPRAKGIA
jgi:hypothetical protein